MMRANFKKNPSKVTIGLCIKDAEITIKEAIRSICVQDYPHEFMEVIVVDGCSKDKTLQIIQEIAKICDLGIRWYSENKGLGFARQIVVDEARGDFIIWVDGDMVLTPDFVTKQIEFMDKHPNAGIAKGKYAIRQDVQHENIVAILEDSEFIVNTFTEGEINSQVLGTSGCIYRVEAIKRIGGFDQNIKGVGEDMDVEQRVRRDGWQLFISPAVFYETRRQTWSSLWKEYFWHGSGGRYMFKKDRRIVMSYKMLPPIAVLTEIFRISTAYRLTHRKIVLLLPFHYIFKRTAWLLGFIGSFIERSNLRNKRFRTQKKQRHPDLLEDCDKAICLQVSVGENTT